MLTPNSENIEDLFADPDLFFWQLIDSKTHFVRMSREHFHQTIFSDNRIIPADTNSIPVDTRLLLKAHQRRLYPEPKLAYIFHVAHCGSTLLARALDILDHNLVYREPYVLRQLAMTSIQKNWGNELPGSYAELLKLTTVMLSKKYSPDAPVIVKANVPVNHLLSTLMSLNPNGQGLLLYASFENYLLSLWENHQNWASNIASLYQQQIFSRIGLRKSVV